MKTIDRACDVCGVDVRDGSLFCYNCGSSVNQAASRVLDGDQPEYQSPEIALNKSTATDSDSKLAANKKTNIGRPKRARPRPTQPRDVVWEQPNGFGFGFLVTAVALILLTAGLLALGLYLK